MAEQKNNKIIGVILVAALLGGLYLFSRQNEEVSNPAVVERISAPEAELTDEVDEESLDEAVRVFEVHGEGFSFSPTEIVVNKGDTVRIRFINDGGMHDWVIDEFNARTEIIQTGEVAEVEFVADTAGSFEYYCSVMSHREMGMVGTLVVEDVLE